MLLGFVLMFEGFDISLTSVVLPYVGSDFGITTPALGRAVAAIAAGSIVAVFLIRLADRFGRRPILLIAAGGFSIGSLLTVLAPDIESYVAIQFVTRMLMVSLVSLAYLVVSETLPPPLRGRANGLLGAVASMGAALPFLMLKPALETEMGWRLLFVVGSAPLIILPLLFIRVKETPVWAEMQASNNNRITMRTEFVQLVTSKFRQRFAAMSALWFIINFASAAGTVFFTYYVTQERGWSTTELMAIAPLSLLGAFIGYIGAGALADWIGRRPTIASFLFLYGVLTLICYSAEDSAVITASFVGLQAMLGLWMICFTLNSELFPTELRAAANGWSHNMVGRWGAVVAPLLLGELSALLGGTASAAMALAVVPWLGIPLILFALPETKAIRLDEQP
ncbi:MFS transporter [Tsuneonella aeria]